MQIDPSANVDAFSRLADKTGEVQSQIATGMLKKTMDVAEESMAQLLQSMQPHLGQNVDIRL